MKGQIQVKDGLSRRNFLRGAGVSVAGLAVVGSAGLLVHNSGIATASTTPATLPYKKIDPDKAMAAAYEGYSKGG
jgi:hypothetical protein